MHLTPMKAIRAKCLDCCGGSAAEVRRCDASQCALHAFRTGKRPRGYTDTTEDGKSENTLVSPHIFTAEAKKESPLAQQPTKALRKRA